MFAPPPPPLPISAVAVGASTQAPYRFRDITNFAGVSDDQHGHIGSAWFDYNNDGWYDLYLANGLMQPFTPESTNVLFENNGDGTFTDVSLATGTDDPYLAIRNVAADYDNDGDQDLYSHNFDLSTLYRNDGGVFTDVNAMSGAGAAFLEGTGATWVDYDNDGLLDLHLTSFSGENALFHNNGDGTFINMREAAGLPQFAAAMGNAWVDYDNDGDLDLAAASTTPRDVVIVYENNGNGTFTDVSASTGIVLGSKRSSAPVTWGDFDNDGWLDLFISEVGLGSEEVFPPRMYLFHNNQDGTFTDVTAIAGLSAPSGTSELWDASWVDYDHDGDIDLFVASTGPNSFWQNNGDGTFTDIAPQLGLDGPVSTAGVSWADYDNDNDMDFYLIGLSQQVPQPNRLYQNTGGTNNWLYINLVGTVSNRDGIGARVTITVGGKQQIREVSAARGFFSQDSKTLEFGLGTAVLVETVEIRWPSGLVQTLSDVSANQVLSVVEELSWFE